jgi:predicted PurR-regulated permease PerM
MTQKVEISYKTIIFTVFFLIFLYIVFQIKDILFLLFLSVIAASGLRPVVNYIERAKVPRIFAILLVYLVVLILLFLLGAYITPILIKQTTRLVQQIGYFFSVSFLAPYIVITAERITDSLTSMTGNIYRATVEAFSILINFFTFFVFTFYLLLERRHLRVFLRNFLGEELKERIVKMLLLMELRLGAWVRGEAALGVIIGSITYIGLLLLNIEFALPLAIIAGLLELIPIIGPIISAVPAVIVALLISPLHATLVIALYFLIQQFENHLIVPLVMKRAVGVPPMVSIMSILIGARLAGVIGAVLSIPLFVCAQIVFHEYYIAKTKHGDFPAKPSGKQDRK